MPPASRSASGRRSGDHAFPGTGWCRAPRGAARSAAPRRSPSPSDASWWTVTHAPPTPTTSTSRSTEIALLRVHDPDGSVASQHLCHARVLLAERGRAALHVALEHPAQVVPATEADLARDLLDALVGED